METTSTVKNSDGPAGIFAGMDPRCVPLVLCNSQYLIYRWKNWWIRGVFAFVMIAVFVLIILLGPLCLTLLVCHVNRLYVGSGVSL